jgi:hypothetical protein
MKAKLVRNVKKLAAVATGALFVGATLGMASVFASGLSSLPGPFVSNGHVNAVFVVGANAAPTDVLGAIDVSAALTAAAAATHSSTVSGQVTIGTLALKSKLSQTTQATANDTLFGAFSPSSSIVDISNATYTLSNGTKINASWQERFSFSTASGQKPFINGLNVEFPSKSFSIVSTLNNRNNSDKAMPLMNDTEYLIGSKPLYLIGLTAKNASFGVLYNASDVPIGTSASSIVAGPYTVDLTGISKILTATGTTNELEFNVNGGKAQYANLSSSVSLDSGKLVITFGKNILENSTGDYLSSIDISSISLVQNNSAANVFGLGPYNVSWAKGGDSFDFTYTGKQVLDYSFSKATSFPIMANLSTVSLQPLVPASFKKANYNISVTTGSAGNDYVYPTLSLNASNNSIAGLSYHGSTLPGVSYGINYRGNLTESGPGAPNLLLEHYQSLLNISSGAYINASSEYIYPTPAHVHYWNNNSNLITSTTSSDAISYGLKADGAITRFIYELPTGNYIALQFSNLNGGLGDYVPNLTNILNYTASSTSNPTIITPKLGILKLDGYNLTISKVPFNESGVIQPHTNASAFSGYINLGKSAYINATIGKSGDNTSVYNITGKFIIPNGTEVYVYTNRTSHVIELPLNTTIYASPNSTAHTNLSLTAPTVPIGYLNVTNSSLKLMYNSNATEIDNNTVNSSIALSNLSAFYPSLSNDVKVNTSTKVVADYIGIPTGSKLGIENISVNLTKGKVSPVGLFKGDASAFANETVTLENGTLILGETAPFTYTYSLKVIKGTKTGIANNYIDNISKGNLVVGNYSNSTFPSIDSNVELINGSANPSSDVSLYYAKLTGPSSEISANGLTYNLVPNQKALYASNGTSLQSAGVDNGYLGTLKFNGSELVYTDPLGEAQMIGITENKSTFATNISASTKNTTANTWGDFVNNVEKGNANIAIPVQNYTVALAGAQTIIGQQNYTIGQTVSSGKLLGVSGVSTINAGNLINSNPDIAILDNNFTGSTNDVPVIVIGGPAINTLADTLLNQTAPVYGAKFTNLTGIDANKALIEMFDNVSAFNNQPALWVAGYSASGTLEASEVLAESLVGQPVVNLTGNKVILSTSAATYKGVSIVPSNSSS